MKYPCLVPERLCNTKIQLVIEQEGLTKYGEPLEAITINAMGNYQNSAKTVLTAEKKLVTLSARALFTGDICPTLPNISGGTAYIWQGDLREERRIYEGRKARNPDGTVNYTEVTFE